MGGFSSLIWLCLFFVHAFPAEANRGTSQFLVNGTWSQANLSLLPPALGRSGTRPIFPSLMPGPSPREIADAFLRANYARAGASQASDFRFRSSASGPEGTSLRFQQERSVELISGARLTLPISGSEIVVHVKGSQLIFASASAPDTLFFQHKQTLTPSEARGLALLEYGPQAVDAKVSGLKLFLSKSPQGEMKEYLAYAVAVRGENLLEEETLFIDASNGALLRSVPKVQTHGPQVVVFGEANRSDEAKLIQLIESTNEEIHSHLAPETLFPVALSSRDCPLQHESTQFCVEPNDEKTKLIANYAWRNAELTDSFFRKKFMQNSFDGSGGTIRSLIRFRAGWANAGWVDELGLIVYGDGNPFVHHPFARALDISAHELTHGLTARSSQLEYVAEAGALNESYSDVFAKLISREFEGGDDWVLGRSIFLAPDRFIRDMKNPSIGHVNDQIHRNETCTFRNDGCGVHSNSGIPNRAAALLAEKIGVEDLGKLYFSVLTRYLRPNSDFKDVFEQTLIVCELIWGAGDSRCTAVISSFKEVGIE